MKIDETLGQRIEKLRKENGLTMNELAKRIEVSHVQVSNYEKDSQIPSAVVLMKIADVLDTSSDYLLKGHLPHLLKHYLDKIDTLSGPEQLKLLNCIQDIFKINGYMKLKKMQLGDMLDLK